MTTGGRKFHPGKFINDAKIDAKYWQHRTIADLFIKWIRINEDNDPAFDPFNRDAVLKLTLDIFTMIRRQFNTSFPGDKVQFYHPTEEEIEDIKNTTDLSGLSNHGDLEHVYESCCFVNSRHNPLVKHDFFFLTFDKDLEHKSINYGTRLGKLAIMYYARIMDMLKLHRGPERLLQ
jgi:hypothetical protein